MERSTPLSEPLGVAALPLARRAHEFVAHELLVLILSGRFRPGDRLPSERELAAHLGVSRPTVRLALGLLAEHGLVETRVGSGTFVVPSPELDESALPHGPGSVREVMESRLVVEVAIARLAARRTGSGAADLELLRAIVEALERSADKDSFPARIDVAFHRTVVELTSNSHLAALAAPLWETIPAAIAPALARGRWTADDTARVAAEHRAVFEAVRAGDAELAGFAMERHLRAELAKLVDETSVDGPPPRFFA
jgi:GntR family transcriptional repressor for pyruvate dehydrogenase complex